MLNFGKFYALNLKVSQAEFLNLISNLTCDTKYYLQVFRGDFWGCAAKILRRLDKIVCQAKF